MKYLKLVFVAILFGLGWLVACGGPNWALVDLSRPLAPRPIHYGRSLPYPVSAPPLDMSDRIYRAVVPREAERLVPVVLQIDEAGRIRGLSSLAPNDSGYVARYRWFLERYRFEPGLEGGVAVPMSLLVDLQTSNLTAVPIVRFPVDPNRTIHHYELYWRAFAELSIEVPALVSFPSYHYRFSNSNRWRRYPFKVYRVELDSTGAVLSTETVRATNPYYSRQINSAVHWGEYSPLRIDGQAYPTSCFLIVSLYPMVKYPTKPLRVGSDETPAPWDWARVLLVPDTNGLLPPVPKREWSGENTDTFHWGMTPELVSIRIAIDTSGNSIVSAVSTDFHRAQTILNARSRDIMFYPALQLNGTPQVTDDLVYLRYLNQSNVRIWFNWLGGSDPGPPVQESAEQ